MHRNSLLLAGLACLLVLLCAIPGAAQTVELLETPQLEAQNCGNTLVEILPLATYEKAIEGEQWLRLKYRVRNLTSEPIRSLEVEAKVYDSEGCLTGFYGYLLDSELAPDENRLFLHRTSAYTLRPGDRVVLAPVRVETSNQVWETRTAAEEGKCSRDKPTV